MPYIGSQGRENLLKFKYAGGTDSITYQYLWSPMNQYFLNFIPETVAPNLITFVGFMILAVTHILFMLPDESGIPNWKLVMMGVAILVYQHLDNIDGKQARRTNSSSPLGMLFDHGADSLSSFLISVQVLKILHVSYSLQLFAIYIFIMSTYFCAMWNQYSIGYFRLGIINPVDEGLPVYALLCFICTQFDFSSFFEQQHIIDTFGNEIIYALLLLLPPVLYTLCKDILKNPIRPVSEILFIPILYILAGLCCLLFFIKEAPLTGSEFYPFYYCLLFMWSRNMILIQLQYIVRQKYEVSNLGTNIFIGYVVIYWVLDEIVGIQHEEWYFWVCAFLQFVVLMQFCVNVMREGAIILNINVFSLGKRKQHGQ